MPKDFYMLYYAELMRHRSQLQRICWLYHSIGKEMSHPEIMKKAHDMRNDFNDLGLEECLDLLEQEGLEL